MVVPALSAARSVCELKDWTVSNLELQKLLYIAHMFRLGEAQAPLVAESFQAWDYGPVVPQVYRQVKGFGSGPIRNVFNWVPSVPPGPELDTLRRTVDLTRGMTAGTLVAITHWPQGAWSKVYQPNTTGITIPNHLIAQEYEERRTIA
ncbi:Panacea domain-containing protein [uncultured Zoogloea sp.]|uniref:Panacea domain-containing protein n=1 Tax=uncultured Zoogloea sp. TaxID=160237 RepID=UPI00262D21A9|nr:type II toxin-antitoxin system antitoxin SocA domain-containing protein [uncultured Zoogloea sp.]